MEQQITYNRRLIEETFPVKAVSLEASKEKNIRQASISTLHIWWARMPLSSSRATNWAALVPAAANYKEETSRKEFLSRLCKRASILDNNLLEIARKEILDANSGRPPRVLDPFSGGGSIPFESLRLGCETFASDYNPVATLTLKCTLDYPQRYGTKHDSSKTDLSGNEEGNRLLEDVRRWGNWIELEVKKEINEYYPAEEEGYVATGYIWARTIPCQNPSCRAVIPLMKQYWLANTPSKKIALFPISRSNEIKFKLVGTGYDAITKNFDPYRGSVSRAIIVCQSCGSAIDAKMTKKLFVEGKSGQKIVAVVLQKRGMSGKRYRLANEEDYGIVDRAKVLLAKKRQNLLNDWGMEPIPDEPTPDGKGRGAERAFSLRNYGLTSWGDLFNPRQKLLLLTIAEKILRVYKTMQDQKYENDYAKAIVAYLAITFDRMVMSYNTMTSWQSGSEKMRGAFTGQTIPIVWDYAEPNANGDGVRSWHSLFADTLDVIQFSSKLGSSPAVVSQNSATSLPYQNEFFDAVFTDPPYYDNVPYSHLSDFFYVWLKRLLGQIFPELFSTPLSPKSDEIVAYSNRPGGFEAGKKFFEDRLRKSFTEINRVMKPNGITLIVYAHKSTAGWETLINSISDAGLVVTAAWPIHTERKTRIRGQESAALTSSIYIVARKYPRLSTGFYNEVKQDLKETLGVKLEKLWDEGISGGDFLISGIGSALEIGGRYEKIIDDEGNVIRADRLLEDTRRLVTDYAVKQVLHNGFAAELKPMTRFYVLWRWAYGEKKVDFDDARKLAQSVGIDLALEWNRGFIRKDKEYIEVLGPEERRLKDLEGSKEIIDVLQYVVILWKQGKSEQMVEALKESGFGKSDVFYRVAQAISESLPNDAKEKKLLEGFLSGRQRITENIRKLSGQTRLFEK